MPSEHLGERIARLRRARDLAQEALAERAGVSVDVVRKLEQQRKHSARLPTLHSLATGLDADFPRVVEVLPGIDVARAKADVGDKEGAVKALQRLRNDAPSWMRHHTLAVSIVTDLRHQAGPQPLGLRGLVDFLGVE